ncbi:hypothetical protein BRD00_11175 [Halobacteriales archaeon QS_8_69_26]|nr:MAG: hypothetical protein BRD00_11175 [Halobacteriales archaeon QS_8_69_26]
MAPPGPDRTTPQTTRGLLAYAALPVVVGLALLALSAPLVLVAGLVGLAGGALAAVAFARSTATADRAGEPTRTPR